MSQRTSADHRAARPLALASLTALGVVYGDIGTSPLYALREAFYGPFGIDPSPANIIGVLSLIFWSLVLIVTIKYVVIVIRADNKGEGGILALMALIQGSRLGRGLRPQHVIAMMAVFGTALMYGDGVITPAISVMGAVEGIAVAAPALAKGVIPAAILILIGLFLLQHRGTHRIGVVFGPVMLLWFVVLAVLGARSIVQSPAVLSAVLPQYAVQFAAGDLGRTFVVMGAVFLVVTGGEALYADLGHFGARPIQLAWFAVALPSLLLNYFGQAALLLRAPEAAVNPFYLMAPGWALYPLIVLATSAAVIASQAVITGAFSVTRQAVQLGYSPRLKIEHTSLQEIGQIYVPAVNWALMLATCALVIGFRTSSDIAGAYGVAVSGLMVITTLMFYVMSRKVWMWSFLRAALVAGIFLVTDLAFLGANALKIPHGGWLTLLLGLIAYILMMTWQRGREILAQRLQEHSVPLAVLLVDVMDEAPNRVPGTAVYMMRTPETTPPALVHSLTHFKVLHEQIVFVAVVTQEVPYVPESERVEVKTEGEGFYSVVVRYGFMQGPDIPAALSQCEAYGLDVRMEATTFFLGRETLLTTKRPGMAPWRERLFGFMSRNASAATGFFRIPPDQVFEVGVQIEM